MGRFGTAILSGLAIGVFAAPGAMAQSLDRDLDTCGAVLKPELAAEIVRACTAILDAAHVLNEDRHIAYLNRADANSKIGNKAAAVADYDQSLRLRPDYTDAYRMRGAYWYDNKDYAASVRDFDKAISLGATDAVVFYYRGAGYYGLKDYARALDDANRAAAADPNFTLVAALRGDTYYALKDYPRAISAYDELIRKEPANKNAYAMRGDSWYFSKDYQRAIADYDAVIRLDPVHGGAWRMRGDSFFELENYKRALEEYDQALKYDTANADNIRVTRGDAYYFQSDYVRAIAEYDEAIKLKTDVVGVWRMRGNAFYGLKDYTRALKDFDEGLKVDTANASSIQGWRGDSFYYLADYPKAISAYDEAIRLNPQFASAYHMRGRANAELKNHTRSIADYDRAAEIDPANATRHNQRCWQRAVAGVELDVARAACDRALALVNDANSRASYLDSRALVSLKQQRNQDAWKDYNDAVTIRPDYAHGLYGRGIAAIRLGRAAEGQADLAAAAKLDATVASKFAGYDIAAPVAAPAGPAPDLSRMGAGELFARADELDQQGRTEEARAVRRTLIARFPDSPLAATAAQQLARPAGQ